ncbi:MAG: hypothetical protein WB507_14615 [Solirubrobacterales bacterium]
MPDPSRPIAETGYRRRASPVRNAAAKSIANESPRPSGPVTNQALVLSNGDTRW